MSTRRKPISAKLKKSLLKEKREKKRNQEEKQKSKSKSEDDLWAPKDIEEPAASEADPAEDADEGDEDAGDIAEPDAGEAGSGSDDDGERGGKGSAKGSQQSSSSAYLAKKRAERAEKSDKLTHKLSYDPDKLRTVFAEETKEDVERRKADGRKPIVRVLSKVSELGYYKDVIPMPVRPHWSGAMSKDELNKSEEAAFREYLQEIYTRYPVSRLNYFEHNLEVWRQLWRTCERSDVLLVVADVRHPLFHFPPSLHAFVARVLRKPLVLVLNKIDMVSRAAVDRWVAYFKSQHPTLRIVPFTAHPGPFITDEKPTPLKKRKVILKTGGTAAPDAYGTRDVVEACRAAIAEYRASKGEAKLDISFDSVHKSAGAATDDKDGEAQRERKGSDAAGGAAAKKTKRKAAAQQAQAQGKRKGKKGKGKGRRRKGDSDSDSHDDDDDDGAGSGADEGSAKRAGGAGDQDDDDDAGDASADDVVDAEAAAAAVVKEGDEAAPAAAASAGAVAGEPLVTIGVVGHPNAGKSSLINALVGKKVVSVSKTPGHTKYIQTIFLNKTLQLCDCPGLVFPAVDMPRPLQVLCGLFPIAQTREPYSAIAYLAARVPLALIYNLRPPKDEDDDEAGAGDKDEDYRWSAWGLCEALARQKNFRTRKGTLDTHRAGNQFLQDCVNGVVVMAFDPPAAAAADSAAAAASAASSSAAPAKPAVASESKVAGSGASAAGGGTALPPWKTEMSAWFEAAKAPSGKESPATVGGPGVGAADGKG